MLNGMHTPVPISCKDEAAPTLIKNNKNNRYQGNQTSPISHTIASQISSATSTVVFYPFDTIRIRFMSQDGTLQRQHNGQTYSSIWRAITTVWREEGTRALFRACHIAVLGAVCSWGVYMYLYRMLSDAVQNTSYSSRAGASVIASLVAACVSSPLWLVKSRMQIEEVRDARNYKTFRGGFLHIVQTTGIRSLWRGTSLQMLLVFPNALNFPTYDMLKGFVLQHHKNAGRHQEVLTIPEVLFCSVITKTFLVSLSHPIMLLKVRLQDQRSTMGDVNYTDIHHSLMLILRREGARGLFRGLCTSLLHTLPRSIMHFALYEKVLDVTVRYI